MHLMTAHMPQEIEVWYMLPALRRELTRIFVKEFQLSQKDAAKLLGLTESAISQYVKAKRGNDLIFTEDEKAQIRKAAAKMHTDRNNAPQYFYDLTALFRGSQTMCQLHKKLDTFLPSDCAICRERTAHD